MSVAEQHMRKCHMCSNRQLSLQHAERPCSRSQPPGKPEPRQAICLTHTPCSQPLSQPLRHCACMCGATGMTIVQCVHESKFLPKEIAREGYCGSINILLLASPCFCQYLFINTSETDEHHSPCSCKSVLETRHLHLPSGDRQADTNIQMATSAPYCC